MPQTPLDDKNTNIKLFFFVCFLYPKLPIVVYDHWIDTLKRTLNIYLKDGPKKNQGPDHRVENLLIVVLSALTD